MNFSLPFKILLSIIITCVILFVLYISLYLYSFSKGINDKPLFESNFFFHLEGEQKTFYFQPRLFKQYCIEIKSEVSLPHFNYESSRIGGKIKWELYLNDRKVRSSYLNFKHAITTFESLKNNRRGVDLYTFDPITDSFLGFYPGKYKLVLTVEEKDEILIDFVKSLKISFDVYQSKI